MASRERDYILFKTKAEWVLLHLDNTKDQSKYNARVLFLIVDGITNINELVVIGLKIAKEVYNILRAKYYDLRPTIAILKLRELVIYKKKEEDSIQVIQSKLLKIKIDIVAIKLKFRESYKKNKIIIRLLNSLPESYASTIDGLKAREILKVYDALRIL